MTQRSREDPCTPLYVVAYAGRIGYWRRLIDTAPFASGQRKQMRGKGNCLPSKVSIRIWRGSTSFTMIGVWFMRPSLREKLRMSSYNAPTTKVVSAYRPVLAIQVSQFLRKTTCNRHHHSHSVLAFGIVKSNLTLTVDMLISEWTMTVEILRSQSTTIVEILK